MRGNDSFEDRFVENRVGQGVRDLEPSPPADEWAPNTASSKLPRRTGRRRRILIASGLIVAILAGLGALGYVEYRQARVEAARLQQQVGADLHAGQADLEAAKEMVQQANAAYDSRLVDRARADLTSARSHFLDARRHLDSSWVIRDGQSIPIVSIYVAPRKAAVEGISAMGVALCNATADVVDLDEILIKPDGSGTGGEKLLKVLQAAPPVLTKIHNDFVAAQGAILRVDPKLLSADQAAQLANARKTVNGGIQGIDNFRALIPGLIEILGGNQPRTYLLLPQNQTELRSGGGFISTYGVINADRGRISMQGDIHELDSPQSPHFAPPNWMTGFAAGHTWKLEDSNVFPNFDANAKAAEFFADRVYHTRTDGVIAMDTKAVQSLLSVTGPVVVPEYGTTVSTENFDREVIQRSVFRDPSHKDILGAISKPLIQKISELPANRWPKLVQVMNDSVGKRHLQLSLHNPEAQGQLVNFGWSPLMNATKASDYMFEVESNMGGAKSNYFLSRSFDLTLSRQQGTLHHQLAVTIDNTARRPGGNQTSQYVTYMQMYTGKNVSNSKLYGPTISPPDYTNKETPDGFALREGWLNKTNLSLGVYKATWEWDTPWTANALGEHDLYWQKQPGTGDDKLSVTWQNGSQNFQASGDLSQDRAIHLSPGRVTLTSGQAPSAQLPGLSF